ncbi:unnamed protein product [Closterium sp. Yama58-4]|nr:unnamed protein product [Closterium sp. Yama58-4]
MSTMDAQDELEEAVSRIYGEWLARGGGLSGSRARAAQAEEAEGGRRKERSGSGGEGLRLLRERHVRFLLKGLDHLSSSYASLDASRPWLVFWIVHSLSLLQHPLDASLAARCADTLRRCQHPEGGFGGGPGQLAHLATTYAAVAALLTVGGEEALSVVNRRSMLAFLRRMKCQSGGFRLHQGGETDVRGCYTAMAVAHLLCIRTPDLTENVAAYVHSCQTYEGGIGGEPCAEAHGGYTFCGLAAVLLAGADPWEHLDLPLLLDWLVFRQGSVEGGFQGRSNKLVDACYSLWQGGLFPLLALCSPSHTRPSGDASSAQQPSNVSSVPHLEGAGGDRQGVQAGGGEERAAAGDSGGAAGSTSLLFLHLLCLQVPEGGLRDKPGKSRDYYHTCYALSGLTAAQHSLPVTFPHAHNPQQPAASVAQGVGVGGSVLGPVSNLLAVAEPRCNRAPKSAGRVIPEGALGSPRLSEFLRQVISARGLTSAQAPPPMGDKRKAEAETEKEHKKSKATAAGEEGSAGAAGATGGGGEAMGGSSGFKVLKEGAAEILVQGNDVFYNKAQVVNRDLSVCVLRAFVAVRREEENQRAAAAAAGVKGRALLKHPNADLAAKSAAAAAAKLRGGEKGGGAEKGEGGEKGGSADKGEGGENGEAGDGEGEQKEQQQQAKVAEVKPLRILEGLAASGLRSIRYAKEIPGVGTVVALDNDPVAVQACQRNEFDAVDLDPYGTPSVFLDGAVQAVADGGMLLVTATDMAVLCGNNAEVCYSKYGAYPHRAKYCHEMAIRILLASIESAANRFKRHIVPVLSVSVDFYIRVFVRVFTSAQAVKATPSKLAYVFQCSGCDSYHLQPVGRVVEGRAKKPDAPPPPPRYLPGLGPVIPPACEHCGRHLSIGGPMWSAPIHDASWVRLVLGEVQAGKAKLAGFGKVHGLLTAVSEELHDIPLYIDLHEISTTLKCTPPSMLLFRSALVNAGHRVSGAHSNPLGIKTDAPLGLIWDVMRCWIRDHPVKSQGEGSPADTILAKPPTTEVNFAKAPKALSKAQQKGVARFVPNPEAYWGPKPRAGRKDATAMAVLAREEGAEGKEQGGQADGKRDETAE